MSIIAAIVRMRNRLRSTREPDWQRAGRLGENLVADAMGPRFITVSERFVPYRDGRTQEIKHRECDVLIVGQYAVYAAEVKAVKGTIIPNQQGRWGYIPPGQHQEVRQYHDLARHQRWFAGAIRDVIEAHGQHAYVYPLVVFTNRHADISRVYDCGHVIYLDEMRPIIERNERQQAMTPEKRPINQRAVSEILLGLDTWDFIETDRGVFKGWIEPREVSVIHGDGRQATLATSDLLDVRMQQGSAFDRRDTALFRLRDGRVFRASLNPSEEFRIGVHDDFFSHRASNITRMTFGRRQPTRIDELQRAML